MPPAARINDQISHTATPLTPGVPNGTVGVPGGAAVPGLPPGAGAPLMGVPSVRIAGQPAAVVGSLCVCALHAELGPGNVVIAPVPPPLTGAVLIGGYPAARKGDRITCQATISTGTPNVTIGG
ncbi:PAAR domain-containing protein [Planosporangium sp. 12N6]|uniref:PAAR domain-containing protein n=1 Tax=Planosporangium spinosum TaxID=3402278 RepID=UPI003CF5DDF6